MKPKIKVNLDGHGGGEIIIGKIDVSSLVQKIEIIGDAGKQETKLILTMSGVLSEDAKIKAEIDNLKAIQFVDKLEGENG